MIDENSLEKLLRPLIEVDTSNPPGRNYTRIVKIIEQQLAPTGCEVQLVEAPENRVKELYKEVESVSGSRINLIASLRRGKGKTIILNGHTDVVPANGIWMYPPFKLSKKGRKWYGRGVADMKGALATLILVFKELADNPNWKGTIILTAVADEEIGGYTGTAYLHDSGLVKGDYCIVGDGDATHITNAANGCLRFRVTLKGKSVHASRNWLGVNAINKAAKLITRLEEYNDSLHNKKSKVLVNPDFGVDRITPSLTVGLIKGGTKVNIVPDKCVVNIDRRTIPEENKGEAIIEFEEILKEFKRKDEDFDYNLLTGGFHDSFQIPEDNELIITLRRAYEEVTKSRCEVWGGLGCYDAAHVAKHNIPVAVLGASRVDSNIHGINEQVRIEDLINLGRIIKETVLRLTK